MDQTCPKCGGEMEPGNATAYGLIGEFAESDRPRLVFQVTKAKTSLDVVSAFKQGLSEGNIRHRISGVRCAKCGFLELYAQDP